MRLYTLARLLAVFLLTERTDAFCPVGCFCDDETLQVTCDEANLEVIPITLNPSVQVTNVFSFPQFDFLLQPIAGVGYLGNALHSLLLFVNIEESQSR